MNITAGCGYFALYSHNSIRTKSLSFCMLLPQSHFTACLVSGLSVVSISLGDFPFVRLIHLYSEMSYYRSHKTRFGLQQLFEYFPSSVPFNEWFFLATRLIQFSLA